MSTIQRPYSDSYLLAYSDEHVLYEIGMLFRTGAVISNHQLKVSGPTAAHAETLANVLVEAFGLHLRNVIDFLFLERPKPTDIVAADFCAPGGWEEARATINATLEVARSRANRELAHLTTDRQSGPLQRRNGMQPHCSWS